MENIKSKFKNLIIVLACLTLILLLTFKYHINKNASEIIVFITPLIWLICLFSICFYVLYILFKNISKKQISKELWSLSSIVCYLTLFYYFLSPWKFDSENLESKTKIRACYEGTQNTAVLKFKENATFELNWKGVFGYNKWWTGKWKQSGDTLFLQYDNSKIEQLGDTLLISKGYLVPIANSFNKEAYSNRMFYLGKCRNLN